MLSEKETDKILFQDSLLNIKRANILQDNIQYLVYTYYSNGDLMSVKKVDNILDIISRIRRDSEYVYQKESPIDEYRKTSDYYIKIEYLKDNKIMTYTKRLDTHIDSVFNCSNIQYEKDLFEIKRQINSYKMKKDDRNALQNISADFLNSAREYYKKTEDEWNCFIDDLQNNKKYCEDLSDFIDFFKEYNSSLYKDFSSMQNRK